MDTSEMREGRLYFANYQGQDGFAWVKDGQYYFASDEQGSKSFKIDRNDPGLVVTHPVPQT